MTAGSLGGRAAVVTGAGRGIGAAVARALASAGARVTLAARTLGEVEKVAAELRGRGFDAKAVACDVSDERSVRSLGRAVVHHLGAVDILVNNAGVSASAPLRRITVAEWDRMIAINATGTFLCTREFLPAMVERGWGRVVNIASAVGLEGGKYVAHYSASKHAVVGFTRSVALEVAGTGVTVNAVCPGYVDTPMTEQTLANVESRAGLPREKALEAVLATAGQERLITADEVAAAVLRLCLDEGGSTNGEAIVLKAGAHVP